MSTRILALLTTAAGALALAGGITAANASLAAPPPPAGMPSPSASPSSPASPGTASPGKDDAALAECRDADCEVEIKDGQEITLDEKFGVAAIKVKVKGKRVTFVIRGHNSQALTTVDADSPGTSVSFNSITLRPHMTKDGRLMLNVSHM